MHERMKKYFGTDGIRGRVGKPPIAADWVVKLGWAIGHVLSIHADQTLKKRIKVLIGKDTRISGYILESALQAGLLSGGIDCLLVGPMPTPAIAYLTQALNATLGIVISASHNKFDENGIKLFTQEGTKLSDALELEIEAAIDKTFTTVDVRNLGKAQRLESAEDRYVEFCHSTFPSTLDLTKIKMVLDCANGATYKVAPRIFKELGADIIEIGTAPNGYNINQDCGSTNVKSLVNTVLEKKANIGIAFDGDGDRVIMVDHTGEIVEGDELIYIIAKWYANSKQLSGGVVGTVMSNIGLELAIKKLGLDFCRAQVGDRFVSEMLREKGWIVGGESSGHIICLDKTSTGDGIISALSVLAVSLLTGKTLFELKQEMTKYPSVLINIPLISSDQKILEHPKVKQALEETKTKLSGKGRVVLRFSGTEPVLRLMVEGQTVNEVESLAKGLASVIQQYIPKN